VPTPPPSADEHARAQTERDLRLFDWAKKLLEQLGYAVRVENGLWRLKATSLEELRRLAFDADAAEVVLAIRDALHPASGQKDACFDGIREGGLKRIVKNQFDELKKAREKELRKASGTRSAPDWTADLILDKDGAVRPVLANLIRFLRFHPAWEGVLAYDEFHVLSSRRRRRGDQKLRARHGSITTKA
jgi:hypothetical protein